MILGIKTIRKYKLVDKIPSDCDESSVNGGCLLCGEGITMTAADCNPSCCQPNRGRIRGMFMGRPRDALGIQSMSRLRSSRDRRSNRDTRIFSLRGWLQRNETSEHPQHFVAMIKYKSQLLDKEDDGEEYLGRGHMLGRRPIWSAGHTFNPIFNLGAGYQRSLLQVLQILQRRLRGLVEEYADILFSKVVRKEPADLPPLEIRVDRAKWDCNKNRSPPVTQSKDKAQALRKMTEKLLERDVIEPSTARAYSQVHLVPKPEILRGFREAERCHEFYKRLAVV